MKKNVCSRCSTEAECADNGWCFYDPYNKKCPNWLDGVKGWHKFLKQQKKEDRLIHDWFGSSDYSGIDLDSGLFAEIPSKNGE